MDKPRFKSKGPIEVDQETGAITRNEAPSCTPESAGCVLNVTEDDHVANCPKCGKMIRADLIDFDDAKCTECGVELQINVGPNKRIA